jgi:hypothetical protein
MLRSNGALVGTEHTVTALEPVDLTTAQKADPRFYPPGAVAVINGGQAAGGGGQPGRIVANTAIGVVMEVAAKLRTIRRCDLDRLGIIGRVISCSARATNYKLKRTRSAETAPEAGERRDCSRVFLEF